MKYLKSLKEHKVYILMMSFIVLAIAIFLVYNAFMFTKINENSKLSEALSNNK